MNRIQGLASLFRVLRRAAGLNNDESRAEATSPADGVLLADGIDRFFGRLGVRGRVVMSQLPLSVTLFFVVVAAAIFSTQRWRTTLSGLPCWHMPRCSASAFQFPGGSCTPKHLRLFPSSTAWPSDLRGKRAAPALAS
jgi:hypothetical protein